MGIQGGMKCIKYLLFVFNFLFWLAGGVVLGVALWLRHDHQTTSVLELHLENRAAPTTFYVGVYILVGVGAVMMIVGFLGCYGAIQESQCMLGTFFICLIILFACEVAAGIWGFVYREEISDQVKDFYDSSLTTYKTSMLLSDRRARAKAVLLTMHEALDCCDTSVFRSDACPKRDPTTLSMDCHRKINELFFGKLYIIGIAAIVVAIIMIFEMIFSMVLCCGIRSSSVY
ncbi:CD81 molecule a [Callorhinchus milii]|uniref:Tetraspanin n=1 Tax=Callorhinchus milii TaxID=7868 RepID=V9KU11_CALMI|nr:CD81 molecule a [Callorhinchus milii]|eukprot:gi/632940906/ref/XP_007885583.1/ PREDICTED: CD81 antigen [Callorhinchus milii]